jgi:hypothetical protein
MNNTATSLNKTSKIAGTVAFGALTLTLAIGAVYSTPVMVASALGIGTIVGFSLRKPSMQERIPA